MAYRRTYFRGGQVTTPQIIEGAVTEDKIADNAVASPKIKNATIQTEDIADGAVTLDKLGSDVPAVGIADLSITTAKLATEAVTREKINDQAVDSLKIADSAVTNAKIADGVITNAKLATNTITQGKIANNAIGTGEIQNGAVTPEKLSFTPAGLTPITTVTLLNESSADDIDQIINLDAYIPAGANFALLQLRTSAGQLMASPTVSAVIWDDYVTEPVFLANLNQGMIEGSVVTQSGPVRLYGPSAPARAIRVAHIKNGQIAITQVYLYGYV